MAGNVFLARTLAEDGRSRASAGAAPDRHDSFVAEQRARIVFDLAASDSVSFNRDEEFLTVAEIAELFKMNPQTVRNWIDNGQLDAVRVGRLVRVRGSDLQRFISEQTANEPLVVGRRRARRARNAIAALSWSMGSASEQEKREMIDQLRDVSDAVQSLAEALEADASGRD